MLGVSCLYGGGPHKCYADSKGKDSPGSQFPVSLSLCTLISFALLICHLITMHAHPSLPHLSFALSPFFSPKFAPLPSISLVNHRHLFISLHLSYIRRLSVSPNCLLSPSSSLYCFHRSSYLFVASSLFPPPRLFSPFSNTRMFLCVFPASLSFSGVGRSWIANPDMQCVSSHYVSGLWTIYRTVRLQD